MTDITTCFPKDDPVPHEAPSLSTEPLAIIGVACRFAEMQQIVEICGNSCQKEDLLWALYLRIDSRLQVTTIQIQNMWNYLHNSWLFFENNIYSFDTSFFKLPENDITAMDPQQKLLLENVYHALENAGLSAKDVATSRTSVFVGSSNNDHLAFANEDLEMCYKNKATGTSPSILANRISWFYDLRGTSQTIDTACSSSLVAFHQGCLSVRSKDSDMSIISGVNVIEHPAAFLQLTNLGVLSPDGQCFSFDHRANGYGRGEGVSTLIVKPLSSAIQDGNVIRAIVRATGTSHDGKTPGITLPSQTAQAALIRSVYASAHLDMDQTAYVEAHGTGTQVGDPLEIEGIVSAFETRARQRPLYIGSIKAGLGHLEGRWASWL
ncbi:hypothetical protein PtrM4_112440 [Pyrenophora tritici-repentis]|uniref:Ketosynthase family 3 (KS3) domain-containing protein n=1 Tax=Pyrenophora tritici-repentis TaxID=45151 RepID=A0A834RWU3_9PLEO|nr:hypothetical protein PtrM4_112440 [Pyrenophora tritici-repentis]